MKRRVLRKKQRTDSFDYWLLFCIVGLFLMGVAFIAMGEAVGIMMGHILGSGELEDAKKKAGTMRRFTVLF